MPETRQRFSGARIREARHAAGMTQAALAHAVNTRERNIIRWENDQHEPRFENIAAIAAATGKKLEFFTAVGEGAAGDDDAEPVEVGARPLSPDEYALYADLTARIIRSQVPR